MSNDLRRHVQHIQEELSKFMDELECKVDNSISRIGEVHMKDRLKLYESLAKTVTSNLQGGEK